MDSKKLSNRLDSRKPGKQLESKKLIKLRATPKRELLRICRTRWKDKSQTQIAREVRCSQSSISRLFKRNEIEHTA